MPVYNEKDKKKWTKDGRSWYFRVYYEDYLGNKRQKESKKYFTKKEAQEAERLFLMSISQNPQDNSKLTFEELINSFYDWKKDKVRTKTYDTYYSKKEYFNFFNKKKVIDFNLQMFEQWKKEINKKELVTSTKNDILTVLKMILNYGAEYFDFKFASIYKKLSNFVNPNEIKKEIDFYTYDEYQLFISQEDDLIFKTIFDFLYFFGLRKGELRGLQWKNVNWEKHIISIKYQVHSSQKYNDPTLSPLKTNASKRDLPIPEMIFNELKTLYDKVKEYRNYSPDWFVFGNALPISKDIIKDRRNKNCDKVGIRRIRIHDFRHSCASLLINRGASITLVSKYLGHSNIRETLNT